MSKNKSFTIIELLITIVIIGILAGIIIVSTASSIDKANIAKIKVFESNIQTSLALNMVSRWKLDGDANDSWGSNNGTATSVAFLNESECVSGKCGSFNGASYIDCGYNDSLKIIDALTVSIWIKVSSYPSAHGEAPVIARGDYYTSSNPFGVYTRTGEDLINSFVVSIGNHTFRYITTPKVGQWKYISFTYNKNNKLIIYIDGIFNTETNAGGAIPTTTADLKIGGGYDSFNFNGLIDDVRIYNAVLTSSQIKQNYVAGLDSLLSKNLISKKEYNEKIETLSQNKSN